MTHPRVAFVRDWLTVWTGADRVMDVLLEEYPRAPIYALVYQSHNFRDTRVAAHDVRTSFIQKLPGGSRWHRAYLPLMPLAIEQFDLADHDLVISFSHAVAKGVLTRPHQLHVSYVFTPMRYAWDLYFQYLRETGADRGLRSLLVRWALHRIRLWDQVSAARPDVLVAASRHVAARIRKFYGREAQVIYPPVDVDRFVANSSRDEFYLTLSRLVPYKKVDLLVEAFNRLRKPLIVIGDGPDRRKIAGLAGSQVRLLGHQPDSVVTEHLQRCKAFVYAAEEDFGIAPAEAQAAGAPVIAYARGGVSEIVVDGETGLLFERQDVDDVIRAVRRFEENGVAENAAGIRAAAMQFSRERFREEFQAMLAREWARFANEAERCQRTLSAASAPRPTSSARS
jgi:glycosyltransferase involved in cell wall biosynthesis